MTTNLPCPECKTGRLSVVTDGLVGNFYLKPYSIRGEAPELRMEAKPFFACNECEFCLEIQGGIDAVVHRDVPPGR